MSQPRRPKLGQHFLSDARYRRRILEALDLRPDDVVVEIGAGRGAMTSLLAERTRRVLAIELDPCLAEHLITKTVADPKIEVLQADILATDLAELARSLGVEKWFVFGNLPYYITSPILHHLFSFPAWIWRMALLVQREVALRITAIPGTRAYGYLSVLTQFHSEPRIELTVPPGAFSPAPKVYSALVDFQMTAKFPEWKPEVQLRFLEFVKRCFGQKRKNLLNNLAGTYPRPRVEEALGDMSLPLTTRAEELRVEQFAGLFHRLA